MPDHLDFLQHGITPHTIACEFALIADNLARLLGVSDFESIILTIKLLGEWKCL